MDQTDNWLYWNLRRGRHSAWWKMDHNHNYHMQKAHAPAEAAARTPNQSLDGGTLRSTMNDVRIAKNPGICPQKSFRSEPEDYWITYSIWSLILTAETANKASSVQHNQGGRVEGEEIFYRLWFFLFRCRLQEMNQNDRTALLNVYFQGAGFITENG